MPLVFGSFPYTLHESLGGLRCSEWGPIETRLGNRESQERENIMNKASLCLFGGALLGAGLTNPAMADITFDGVLVQAYSFFGSDNAWTGVAYSFGPTSIDTWEFSVLSDGQVQLDMLSYQAFDTWIEPILFLFVNDGNPFGSGNFIASNYDFSGPDLNGSGVDGKDAFLDLFLPEGEYIAAVSAFGMVAPSTVNDGQALGEVYGRSENGPLGRGNNLPTEGQYQLDIFGDVAVPAPGTLALLSLGGFMGTRRKR